MSVTRKTIGIIDIEALPIFKSNKSINYFTSNDNKIFMPKEISIGIYSLLKKKWTKLEIKTWHLYHPDCLNNEKVTCNHIDFVNQIKFYLSKCDFIFAYNIIEDMKALYNLLIFIKNEMRFDIGKIFLSKQKISYGLSKLFIHKEIVFQDISELRQYFLIIFGL